MHLGSRCPQPADSNRNSKMVDGMEKGRGGGRCQIHTFADALFVFLWGWLTISRFYTKYYMLK